MISSKEDDGRTTGEIAGREKRPACFSRIGLADPHRTFSQNILSRAFSSPIINAAPAAA